MGNVCCQQTSLPTLPDSKAHPLSQGVMNFEPAPEPAFLAPAVKQVLDKLGHLDIPQNKLASKPQTAMKHKHDGYVYVGNWEIKGERPEGPGKMYFKNGGYFEGEFKQGSANGVGRYISPEGHYYQGFVANNQASGKGVFHCPEYEFKGIWNNSRPTSGDYTLKNGTQVCIDEHGKGTIVFANKNKYTGDIKNLNPDGQGVMVFDNGNKYEGGWKEGKMHGYGTFQWADGTHYKGAYVNGLKEGTGTFYFTADNRYEGQWLAGKQHGHGKLFHGNNIQFQGTFKEGKPVTEPTVPVPGTPISHLQ